MLTFLASSAQISEFTESPLPDRPSQRSDFLTVVNPSEAAWSREFHVEPPSVVGEAYRNGAPLLQVVRFSGYWLVFAVDLYCNHDIYYCHLRGIVDCRRVGGMPDDYTERILPAVSAHLSKINCRCKNQTAKRNYRTEIANCLQHVDGYLVCSWRSARPHGVTDRDRLQETVGIMTRRYLEVENCYSDGVQCCDRTIPVFTNFPPVARHLSGVVKAINYVQQRHSPMVEWLGQLPEAAAKFPQVLLRCCAIALRQLGREVVDRAISGSEDRDQVSAYVKKVAVQGSVTRIEVQMIAAFVAKLSVSFSRVLFKLFYLPIKFVPGIWIGKVDSFGCQILSHRVRCTAKSPDHVVVVDICHDPAYPLAKITSTHTPKEPTLPCN